MIELALGHAFTADELSLAEQVEDLARTRLAPLAARCDESDELDPELLAIIRGSGLFRWFVPAEHGGHGLSVTALALIRERFAYHSVAADEVYVSQGIPVQPIVLFGSPEQHDTYLPALLEGTKLFSFCLTEPEAGSDVLGLRSTARREGDGFVLDGHKRYAFAGDSADVLLVFAKTGAPEVRGDISAFLFDRPAEGITAEPFPLLAAGPEWELHFDRCVIPASSVLGEIGQGARIALGNLDRLRPSVGVGLARGSITERLYRAIRAMRIYEGASEVMKVVVARSLLGA